MTSLSIVSSSKQPHRSPRKPNRNPLDWLRHRLEAIDVHNPKFAHWVCHLIPPQCPFERDIKWFNRTLLHIPPLCKLNPFYEQLVQLRFKALCYLADECGEDITRYCS